MADVHVPHVEDDPPDAAPAQAAPATTTLREPHRSKSLLRFGLEVILIGLGVFLGLMGEQWREHAQHRELATAALRRFRSEIQTNRASVLGVRKYHISPGKSLEAYLASDGPKSLDTFHVGIHGLGPVYFEKTAWDLALVTGSLGYLDSELAFALSRVYTAQEGYAAQQSMIVQSTLYGRSWTPDFAGYWRSVLYYFNDVNVLEPALLTQYDDVLARLDRALGESPHAGADPK